MFIFTLIFLHFEVFFHIFRMHTLGSIFLCIILKKIWIDSCSFLAVFSMCWWLCNLQQLWFMYYLLQKLLFVQRLLLWYACVHLFFICSFSVLGCTQLQLQALFVYSFKKEIERFLFFSCHIRCPECRKILQTLQTIFTFQKTCDQFCAHPWYVSATTPHPLIEFSLY